MEGTIVEERPSQQEEEALPQDDMDGMEGEMEAAAMMMKGLLIPQ